MLKNALKNTGIYISSSLCNQLIIFLLWVVLGWWLKPADIAIYFLAMFVIDFFTTFCIFAMDSAIGRFYYAKENIASVFGNSLLIFCISAVLFLFFFIITSGFFPSLIPGLSDIISKNILLFLAIIAANSFANFFLVHYVAQRKAFFWGKLQILKALIFGLLSLILIKSGYGIIGLFYSFLLSSLPIIIYFIFKEKDLLSFALFSPKLIKNMLSYSLPILLYNVFAVISAYLSRILLDKYTDLTTLGIYSFFLAFTLQINGVWASFNRAWTPEVFSHLNNGEKKDKPISTTNIEFMVFFTSFLCLLGLVLSVIIGELFLFKILFKDIYLASINIFYVLLLSPLFFGIYTIISPLYYYKNRTKIILICSIIVSFLNIISTILLTKYFHEKGAVFSYLLGSIINLLIYLIVFKKLNLVSKKIIIWALMASFIALFSAFILFKTSSMLLFLAMLVVAFVLSFWMGELPKKFFSLGPLKQLNYFVKKGK